MDDKQKFRKELLYHMCRRAEEIHLFYYQRGELMDRKEFPKAFKPGVADKMLFNIIIDEHFEPVYAASTTDYTEGERLAFGLLMNYYFPVYGEKSRGITWKEFKEIRREIKI